MKWAYGLLTATYLALVLFQPPVWYTNLVLNGFVIIIVSWAHHRKHITTTHYALINVMLVLHNIGSFGLYSQQIAGLYFDKYMHALTGATITYIGVHTIPKKVKLENKTAIALAAIMCTMMIGIGWEIIEYVGWHMEGQGPMQPGEVPLYTDTITDIVLNTVASVIAAIIAIKRE